MGRNLMELPAASWAEFKQMFSAFFSAALGNTVTFDGVKPGDMDAVKHYGECTTAAGTAEKEVSCPGFTLAAGAKIAVKFLATNTANSPTLNVQSTGAKAIHYRGAAIAKELLKVNHIYSFVYDGTAFSVVGDIDTTYTAGTLLMTGYSKPAGTGAVSDSDTVNEAIGKLEKGMDTRKVQQNITTTDAEYNILCMSDASATGTKTNTTRFSTGITMNPAQNSITATKFNGELNGKATKATQDGDGATITSTYVKNARIQQGTATIYNKFVVSGCIVKAVANSRNIQLTETGTSSSTGRSTFFADGGIHTITDGKTAAVPTNTTSAAVTYYACLVKNSSTGIYELKVQSSKTGVLALYRITVPANNTAANLGSVTITDERRIETSYGQFYASRPYVSVALATAFSSADYDVELRATSWDGVDLGELLAYSLANNGFKVEATGAADNISVRWMATAKS